MANYPAGLAEIVEDMQSITDRQERIDLLIEMADRFDGAKVPASVATKPYTAEHKAPACESDAYVWAVDRPDGTLDFYFDVLNPQGLSAMAMSVLLKETLDGQPVEQVAQVNTDIVPQLFGREITMGKGAGLSGIVSLVQYEAKKRLT